MKGRPAEGIEIEMQIGKGKEDLLEVKRLLKGTE